LPSVLGQVSPLAFGTKSCTAADVPKVPQAWGLIAQARSAYLFYYRTSKLNLMFYPIYPTSEDLANNNLPSVKQQCCEQTRESSDNSINTHEE